MENEEKFLELLSIYMELTEKQDEVIYRLSKIVARQATELKHYENICEFVDRDLETDCKIAEEVIGEYEEMKLGN